MQVSLDLGPRGSAHSLRRRDMRMVALVLFGLLCAGSLAAQKAPVWVRVYTFDDSVVELNTRGAVLRGDGTGRFTFRQSFDQPQPAPQTKGGRYLSTRE